MPVCGAPLASVEFSDRATTNVISHYGSLILRRSRIARPAATLMPQLTIVNVDNLLVSRVGRGGGHG